jgi:hypothetical protein
MWHFAANIMIVFFNAMVRHRTPLQAGGMSMHFERIRMTTV